MLLTIMPRRTCWRAAAGRVTAAVLASLVLGAVAPAFAMGCQQALDLAASNLSSELSRSKKNGAFSYYYFTVEQHDLSIGCKNGEVFGTLVRASEDYWSRSFLGRFQSVASLITGKKTEDIAAALARCESRALKSGSKEELKLDSAPDGAFASCEARDGADFSRMFMVTVH